MPSIHLGDVKPPDQGEITLGTGQLASYKSGIEHTAEKVNQFAAAHPDKVDDKKIWDPKVAPLGKSEIEIPDKFKPGDKTGKSVAVVKYRNGSPDRLATPSAIQAYLDDLTYIKDHPGIWMYEYVPVDIPKDAAAEKEKQQKPENDLKPIVEDLKKKPEVKTKRKPGSPPPVVRPRIQRSPDKSFQYAAWLEKFKKWQRTEAEPYLASKQGHNAEVLETLLEIKAADPAGAGASLAGAGGGSRREKDPRLGPGWLLVRQATLAIRRYLHKVRTALLLGAGPLTGVSARRGADSSSCPGVGRARSSRSG